MKNSSFLKTFCCGVSLLLITPNLPAEENEPVPAGFEKIDLVIKMGTIHNDIRFDKETLEVKPGQKIKFEFTNGDEMPHNMLILKAGASTKDIGEKALLMGAAGLDKNYIPESDQILASMKLVLPGKKGVFYFQAPKEKQILPYVCTVPGHYMKMIGKMYVGLIPGKENEKAQENYEIVIGEKPYIYRSGINIPEVGKRAYSIAVGLPGGINYSFDANSCQLSAAWQGKFLNAEADWKGRGGNGANIIGTIFYTNKDHQEISLSGVENSKPKFHGYRVQDGNPTFICSVGSRKMTISYRHENGKLLQKITVWDTESLTYTAKPGAKISVAGAPLSDGKVTKNVRPQDGGIIILEVEITQ